MQKLNWNERAIFSELEFSKALLSQPVRYANFIHIHNPYVPWGGDFNRAVDVQVTTFQSFDDILGSVEELHQEKGLDKPDRFDIQPPVLDGTQWNDYLNQKGFCLHTAIFFCAHAKEIDLPDSFNLYNPSEDEYLDWYSELAKSGGYYNEDWFKQHLPLKVNFIKVFKPYWLLKNKEQVGWVYSANLGVYTRLFEVEINQQFQKQGMGKLLLQAIRNEGYKQGVEHVLLQANDRLKPFYLKSGFQECTKNSIIRRKQ